MTRMSCLRDLLLVSACFIWVLVFEVGTFVDIKFCQQNVLDVFIVVDCHSVEAKEGDEKREQNECYSKNKQIWYHNA